MISAARIGHTYYMGNTYNPETCEVTHLVSFADLPEHTQRIWALMGKARNHDASTDGYVCYMGKRKHGDAQAHCRWLPIDVFCGCAFESLSALYARSDGPVVAGLCRATLPGER